MIKSTKRATGTNTVNSGLMAKFNKDVEQYVNLLQKAIQGDTMFGQAVPMPSKNLMTITDEAIQASAKIMTENGVKKTRAKSVSKYTFEKALESKMLELGL
jgi:hypothetical protein